MSDHLVGLLFLAVGRSRAAKQEEQSKSRDQEQKNTGRNIVLHGHHILDQVDERQSAAVEVRLKGQVPEEQRLRDMSCNNCQPRQDSLTTHSIRNTHKPKEGGECHEKKQHGTIRLKDSREQLQLVDVAKIVHKFSLEHQKELKQTKAESNNRRKGNHLKDNIFDSEIKLRMIFWINVRTF